MISSKIDLFVSSVFLGFGSSGDLLILDSD